MNVQNWDIDELVAKIMLDLRANSTASDARSVPLSVSAETTNDAIEEVNAAIMRELGATGTPLDRLAQEMHAAISDRRIRELHLMEYGAD